MRHERLRRRGADTNQNIFYLVVALIVLAAAAFGFDMGMKSMARSDATRSLSLVIEQTRAEMRANKGLTAYQASSIPGIIPQNKADDYGMILPYGGNAGFGSSPSSFPNGIVVNVTWDEPSGKARGFCEYLASGGVPGWPDDVPMTLSGPAGSRYYVMSVECDESFDETYAWASFIYSP